MFIYLQELIKIWASIPTINTTIKLDRYLYFIDNYIKYKRLSLCMIQTIFVGITIVG